MRKKEYNNFIPHHEHMPLVSFVSLTYNHAKFIEDTIAGALSQDYPNLEIIISDDASPDGTYEVMKQYMRQHPTGKNIILNRNEKNMGLVPHLNYVMQNLVHGDIIVLAGGDDISLSQRVSETVKLFSDDKTIMMVTGQMERINARGEKIEQLPPIEDGVYHMDDTYIQSLTFMCGAPGMAIRREVWDTFGALLSECPTEDSILRFRALMLGSIYVSPNVFIKYRIHENNISRPGNILNLKTEGIVAQLKHDLQVASGKKLVSADMACRLYKKISLYEKYREISAMKFGKPRLIRGFYKVLQRLIEKQISHI